jgi:hypothetical protein
MRKLFALLALLSSTALAQTSDPARAVADDARTLKRIAEVADRDIPKKIAETILSEDLEMLRGRRSDGSYQYAHYEREENGRIEERVRIKSKNESDPDKAEVRGEIVHRVLLRVPTRRMLVARNHRVYVESLDIEYSPFDGARTGTTVEVNSWLEPGDEKSFDIPAISRRATARVRARVEKDPGTLDLILIQAKLVDDINSPYFAAVQTIKSLQKAVDKRNSDEVTALASELGRRLAPATSSRIDSSAIAAVPVTPAFETASTRAQLEQTPQLELYLDLQQVEDLLTGTEAERREGIDRLHQIVRRLRPSR